MASEREIIPVIIAHASYYDAVLGDDVVRMYAADLKDFSIEEIKAAYQVYRNDPKNTRSPLPAQIKVIMKPSSSARGEAIELANKLSVAVEKHDNYWAKYPAFEKEFLETLGQTAWDIVQSRGGWVRFCEQYWSHDRGQFFAQLRDQIENTLSGKRTQALLGGAVQALIESSVSKGKIQ
jgi:hypothetical protein